MKTYLISMLLLVGITSYATPNLTSKNEKKVTVTTISTVESNAAAAMKQLQDENLHLKQLMLNLANESEELKGTLSFQTMMQKMFAQLKFQVLSGAESNRITKVGEQ